MINFNSAESVRLLQDRKLKQELKRLYRQAYTEARKELMIYAAGTTATDYLQTLRLTQLTQRLDNIYSKNSSSVLSNVSGAMLPVTEAVVQDMGKFYSRIGLKLGSSYASVPEEVVASLKAGKVYDSSWTLSKAIWGDNKKVHEEIYNIIARGRALNKSSLELAQDLEMYVNPDAKKSWDWSRVYPGSRTQIDYSAYRLATTMVSHAYEKSIIECAKRSPFAQGIQWYASNSDRTCQLCHERSETDHHGLGKGVYPLDDVPLDHPNGMCTYGIVTLDERTLAERVSDWVSGLSDEELDEYLREHNISI